MLNKAKKCTFDDVNHNVALYHKGKAISELHIDSPSLSITDNTVSAKFSYSATGDDNPANYYVYFDQYALQLDGKWNSDDVTVHFKGYWNQPDPEESAVANYYWMENLSDDATTFSMLDANIEYTLTPDDENSWVDITNRQIDVNGHEKIYLRATAAGNKNLRGPVTLGSSGTILDNEGWHEYDNRVNYKVGGDITTLLDAKGNVMVLPEPEYQHTYQDEYWGVFQMFFYRDTHLQDVSELILPSTTLSKNCYKEMFYGCTNITTSPVLPAYELVDGCYESMFYGCSNLNHVKACLTDWNNEKYLYKSTSNWLKDVAENGVFEKFDFLYCNYWSASTIPNLWEEQLIQSMDIRVPSSGYTTYYNQRYWTIPEDMEGYVAYMGSDNVIHLEKAYEAGDMVWGGALVLKAKAGTYTIQLSENGIDDYTGPNDLFGSTTRTDLTQQYLYTHSDFYWYALSLDENGENIGFRWVNEDGSAFTSAPFCAWLKIDKTHFQDDNAMNSFPLEDIEAGMDAIIAPSRTVEGIYDLSGRRVSKVGAKGIYIIDGKKVMK